MKFPAYPKYKASGVEWLGDVPEHWNVTRLRRVLAESLQYGANESAELDDPDLPRYVRITDVHENGSLRDDTFRSLPKEVAAPYLLEDGDLLFARSGATSGKTFLYQSSWGICAYAGYLIRARMSAQKAFPAFIKYFTTSTSYWQWLSSIFIQSTIQNVSGEKYADLFLSLPPLAEQQAIAAFLDRETGRMDRLVAKKRELIERLKEKRTALISRTVTRGLPPAAARAAGLPENAPLKPSGLDWLGDIPAHWEVVLLKRVAEISYGVGGEIDRSLNDGLKVISLPNINIEGILNLDDVPFAEVSETEKKTVLLRKGDLLFNWRNGSSDHLGKTAYFDAEGEFSHVSFLLRIRFNPEKHDSSFFRYLLAGYRVTGFFKHSKAGVNNTFNLSELSALPVMFPPLPEQIAIATYLDAETAKLDALVAKVETAIERLQEYRTALITAAVTGKIDVRGQVGFEPAEQATA
ncbi:MAG: restriction endonuclease subunit S [Acidobacteria bacterium]|nr:restriction endonuclease subunit S [Acidobacteriota bacterium]